jgi:tRNA threonylcarbamoyladenosine biosynthesis protein TsaB
MTEAGRPLLALDTSTSTGSVAVGTADALLAEVSLSVRGGHSSAILPAMDYALRSAGLRPADLGGVVVGGGPGSFTGLRIAGATAKGVVHALGIPLLSFSGLLAAAAQAWASGSRPVCALFDARGRDLFAACYRFDSGVEVILPPTALTVDEVIQSFRGEPMIFVGDGALRHAEEIRSAAGGVIAPAIFSAPRAGTLLWLASIAREDGRVDDPAAWEPDYLRASGAERIAAARQAEARGR